MNLKDHSMATSANVTSIDLAEVVAIAIATEDEDTLLRLFKLIQVNLDLDVNNLNLTEALAVQYKLGVGLADQIMHDKTVPANQRAQTFNAVNTSIEKIAKMRGVIMSQERLKRYETAVLKAIEVFKIKYPDAATDMREVFMDLYGEYLNDRGS